MTAAVSLCGLSHTYGVSSPEGRGKTLALERVDASISQGEFVSILGPSGCGKSTLLRLVAGLEKATRGEVSVPARGELGRGGIAYVFQDAHLLPWRSVLDNVALPLELRGVARPEREHRARLAIEPLGLGDSLDRYPAELSGGMKMRVSLARALVTEPKLLLMDEPFAALDEMIRFRLAERLRQLWVERGMTVIFVTHSISEAVYLSERVILMSPRPGKIMLDHRVELPRDRKVELRTDPRFGEQSRLVYEAFRRFSEGGEL